MNLDRRICRLEALPMFAKQAKPTARSEEVRAWTIEASTEDVEVLVTAAELGPLTSQSDAMLEALEPIAKRFEQWRIEAFSPCAQA